MFFEPVTLLILVVFSSSATVESLNATATVECGVNATSTVGCGSIARATVECRVNATVVGCGPNKIVECSNATTAAAATVSCGLYASATVECINQTVAATLGCFSATTTTTTTTTTVSPSSVSISLTDWKAKDGECEKCHEGGGGPFDIVRTCEPRNSSQCMSQNVSKTSQDCPTYCPSNAVAITVSSFILVIGIFLPSFREF